MKKILLVEDERDISDIMRIQLERLGHKVTSLYDGALAYQELGHEHAYDLCVVDWMLPNISGLELCKLVRRSTRKQTPILMVTARATPDAIVMGLEAGADDFATKPFELSVFSARVKALLRRTLADDEAADAEETPLEFRELEIDPKRFRVTFAKQEITLTVSEFKLLYHLLKNQGVVLTRKQLTEKVSGPDVFVAGRTIDTHMAGLRKKLGPASDYIETIRGIGYRFIEDEAK